MKTIVVAALLVVVFAVPVFAEVYTWQDKKGKHHAASKLDNVPEEYRDVVVVLGSGKEEPSDNKPSEAAAKKDDAPRYGGETFEWWKTSFEDKKKVVRHLKEVLALKRLYVDIYERGWGMRQIALEAVKDGRLRVDILRAKDSELKTLLEGQLYTPEEVDLYNTFKKEISSESAELDKAEEELWTLERDAKYYGVPHEAWR